MGGLDGWRHAPAPPAGDGGRGPSSVRAPSTGDCERCPPTRLRNLCIFPESVCKGNCIGFVFPFNASFSDCTTRASCVRSGDAARRAHRHGSRRHRSGSGPGGTELGVSPAPTQRRESVGEVAVLKRGWPHVAFLPERLGTCSLSLLFAVNDSPPSSVISLESTTLPAGRWAFFYLPLRIQQRCVNKTHLREGGPRETGPFTAKVGPGLSRVTRLGHRAMASFPARCIRAESLLGSSCPPV